MRWNILRLYRLKSINVFLELLVLFGGLLCLGKFFADVARKVIVGSFPLVSLGVLEDSSV